MKSSFYSIRIYAPFNQEYHSLKFQHITISCVKSLYARAFHNVFCTYLARVNDRLADQSNVRFFPYFKVSSNAVSEMYL